MHSAYTNANLSGENNVVNSHLDIFSKRNYLVKLFSQGIDSSPGLLRQARLGFQVSSSTGISFEKELRQFEPDLTIVHNTFPNIGMRWLKNWNFPTLIYVHNMRFFCPQGALVRGGQICTRCLTNSPLNALRYRCFQKSAIKTLPLVISQRVQNLQDLPHYFVSVSDNYRKILLANGFRENKVFTLPNFLNDNLVPPRNDVQTTQRNSHWIAGGRIAIEKGFENLAEIWPENRTLDIFGEGDTDALKGYLEKANKRINLRGNVSREVFLQRSLNAFGAVIPNRSFEQNSLVEIEFRAAGLPVILRKNNTFNLNANESNIDFGWEVSTDRSFNELNQAILYISDNWAIESAKSREVFENIYSEKSWLNKFMVILQKTYPQLSM